jgi:hypothetical protein
VDDQSRQILNRMQERAAKCVKTSAEKFKLHLDYTDASIPRVEYALAEIHKHVGAEPDKNKLTIVNLANGFGAYIGEVLRKKHGGHWRDKLPDSPPELEGLDVNGVVFSPTVCVFFRLAKGEKYNVVEFYKRTEAAIARSRSSATPPPPPLATTSAGDSDGGMGDYAAKAVAEAKERFGIDLDYSEASLDRFDQVLLELHNLFTDKVPESKKLRADEKFLHKTIAAARYVGYLSEVFRRVLGGEWIKSPAGSDHEFQGLALGGKVIGVELRGQVISLPQIIVNCLNDPKNWSAKNYYFDVKRTHQVDSSLANAASFDDQMRVCAQEAVTIARDRYNVTLDFSEASVKQLETLLAKMHNGLPKPGDPARPSDQWISRVGATFGAYLGEIFRVNLGGSWLKENPQAPGSLPALNIHGDILTPCRKVVKRIVEGPGENVAFFYQGACQIIREKNPRAKR